MADRWSEEEDALLRRLYPDPDVAWPEMMRQFAEIGSTRTRAAMQFRAKSLDLSRPWKRGELDIVRNSAADQAAWDWRMQRVETRHSSTEITPPVTPGWGERRVVFVPDIHFPWPSASGLAILQDVIRDYQPHVVVILGDMLDFYGFSHFGQDPEWEATAQDEIDQGRGFLRWLRATLPDASIHYCEGNHEHRLAKFLSHTTKELSFLRGNFGAGLLTVPELLRLPEVDVHWHAYNRDRLAVYGVLAHHGKYYAANAALKSLDRYGQDGVSAHSHRLELRFKTVQGRAQQWGQAGCLCGLYPEYLDYSADWQQGFVIGRIVEGLSTMRLAPVWIDRGQALAEGRYYDHRALLEPELPTSRALVV